jgi:hypothetical protein
VALAVVLATRGDAAPTDGTARLVPPDALLYAHLSTSEGRTQDARLLALAGRFSLVRDRVPALAMALTPRAGGLDYERDVRPWLGEELAVALLDGGGTGPEPLLLAAVRDRAGAERALAELGAEPAGRHAGTPLLRLPPRATAAFAGDHLVIGPAAAVSGAIDRAAGEDAPPSLADGRVFRRAADGREGAASLELFATTAGLRRLLDGASGLAGVAGRLLLSPHLEGLHAQLAAEERGLRAQATILRASGAAEPTAFEPSLTGRIPRDAAGVLAVPGVDALAGLAERAGGAALLAGIEEALPTAAGIELEDLLAPLGEEAVLTLEAGEAAPIFTLAARTRDAAATRESLARVQGPVSERLGGGPFEQRELRGADAFTLRVTPELEPSYAIARDAVVASTASSGLEQLGAAKDPVTEDPSFGEVVPEDGKVEALAFIDPRELLALGERTGLSALTSPAARDDLGRIGSAGAVVREDDNQPTDTTAELFLEIP